MSKLWKDAERIDEFTGIKLWSISPATYNFFVIASLIIKLKAFGRSYVPRSRHKRSRKRAKSEPIVQHLQLTRYQCEEKEKKFLILQDFRLKLGTLFHYAMLSKSLRNYE